MKRTQILNLGKHFSIIDSPVPFYLVDNYGFRAYRTAGAWQFDNWKLLPEKFHKIYPVYTLSIEWDSGENDDIQPVFMDTDLDLGDGIAGVNGQPVSISEPVTVTEIEKPVKIAGTEIPVNTTLKDISVADGFEFAEYLIGILLDKNPNKEYNLYVKDGHCYYNADGKKGLRGVIVTAGVYNGKKFARLYGADFDLPLDNFSRLTVVGLIKELPNKNEYH